MSIQTQKIGQLEILTAEGITAPHCFTTRLGGVSTGALASMNLAIKLDETDENVRKNFEILGSVLGFGIDDLVLTRQTHSDIVRTVGREDCRGCFHRDYPECDALITNTPGVALTVFTADCTPLLFHDPVTGAVGAAHAGWRGTAAAIGAKTVRAMCRNFGCKPENIRAAIGPNIGFCHFETGSDVPEAMYESFGRDVSPFIRRVSSGKKYYTDISELFEIDSDESVDMPAASVDKYYVNLKKINEFTLRWADVRDIEISEECTMCRPDRYWSHRITGGNRGSQGAVIVCKEGI